jgi:hypothetical protein
VLLRRVRLRYDGGHRADVVASGQPLLGLHGLDSS